MERGFGFGSFGFGFWKRGFGFRTYVYISTEREREREVDHQHRIGSNFLMEVAIRDDTGMALAAAIKDNNCPLIRA